MNQTLKRKWINIATTCFYFITSVALCVATTSLVKKSYFDYIYVSGSSMNPTLVGGHGDKARKPYVNPYTGEFVAGDMVSFGTVDPTLKAKKNIRRYDIITTYYESDYINGKLKDDAAYKIKRVIALPGETFKIEKGELYVKNGEDFRLIEHAHLIEDGGNVSVKDIEEKTLGSNEYWVLGDHRNASSDSGTMKKAIPFDYITGVVVSIDGLAEYFVHYVCSKCGHEVDEKQYLSREIEVCPKCGGQIKEGDGDIRNRQYTHNQII